MSGKRIFVVTERCIFLEKKKAATHIPFPTHNSRMSFIFTLRPSEEWGKHRMVCGQDPPIGMQGLTWPKEAGMQIVGIQDASSKCERIYRTQPCTMYATAAATGQGGCELWIHENMGIKQHQVALSAWQPRCLMAHVSAKKLSRRRMWSSRLVLAAGKRHLQLLLYVGAKAKVGSIETPHVGGQQATFDAKGSAATWKSTRGTSHQVNCIGLTTEAKARRLPNYKLAGS